jgi:hypothetical protein
MVNQSRIANFFSIARPSRGTLFLPSLLSLRLSTIDVLLSISSQTSILLDPKRPGTYARTPDHEQNNFWVDCGNRGGNPREEILTSRSCRSPSRTSRGSATETECVRAPRCRWRTQTSKNCGSCRAPRRRSRAAARRAADDQKLHRRGGMAGARGIVASEGLCGAGRCAASGEAACGRRDYFGKHKYAGIFDGVRDRQFFERQDEQSMGCSAVGRRLERRRGCGHCFWVFGRGGGKRRRRIDPCASSFLRNLRIEADAGKDSRDGTFSRRRRRVRMDRSCRPNGQNYFRLARAV